MMIGSRSLIFYTLEPSVKARMRLLPALGNIDVFSHDLLMSTPATGWSERCN